MNTQAISFTLIFPEWYDERAEFEHSAKGYLPDVEVSLADGSRHRLYFYDTVRLGQDLEEYARTGKPYLGEPGLVVVPEVTREYIHKAVAGLLQEGFFQGLKPLI
jgi:hypothetical protein